MRSVRDILDPAIGMHIGWEVGSGEDESDRRYGEITSIETDRKGNKLFITAPTGAAFQPAEGDRLFYYGAHAKGLRTDRSPEQTTVREIAFADRAAVKTQMAELRTSNARWKAMTCALGGALTVVLILAYLGVQV